MCNFRLKIFGLERFRSSSENFVYVYDVIVTVLKKNRAFNIVQSEAHLVVYSILCSLLFSLGVEKRRLTCELLFYSQVISRTLRSLF